MNGPDTRELLSVTVAEREAWLASCVDALRPVFALRGYDVPANVHGDWTMLGRLELGREGVRNFHLAGSFGTAFAGRWRDLGARSRACDGGPRARARPRVRSLRSRRRSDRQEHRDRRGFGRGEGWQRQQYDKGEEAHFDRIALKGGPVQGTRSSFLRLGVFLGSTAQD